DVSPSADGEEGSAPSTCAAWRRGYRVLTHGAHPFRSAKRAHARRVAARCCETRSRAVRSRFFCRGNKNLPSATGRLAYASQNLHFLEKNLQNLEKIDPKCGKIVWKNAEII
ncbi:MAG: hypothetical protein II369_04190, partial [Clostridia bacterium]|nr:hypothetical protein [Clostridia bacterium]